jgi:hypothetical protein
MMRTRDAQIWRICPSLSLRSVTSCNHYGLGGNRRSSLASNYGSRRPGGAGLPSGNVHQDHFEHADVVATVACRKVLYPSGGGRITDDLLVDVLAHPYSSQAGTHQQAAVAAQNAVKLIAVARAVGYGQVVATARPPCLVLARDNESQPARLAFLPARRAGLTSYRIRPGPPPEA